MPPVLDVAIGTVFVFLLFSLVVSTFNEVILSYFDMRATFLKVGLNELLCKATRILPAPGKPGSWWANLAKEFIVSVTPGQWTQDLVDHGLINAFSKTDGGNSPSYIPAGAFVTALLDLVQKQWAAAPQPLQPLTIAPGATPKDVALQISTLPPNRYQDTLLALFRDSGQVVATLKTLHDLLFTPPTVPAIETDAQKQTREAAENATLNKALGLLPDGALKTNLQGMRAGGKSLTTFQGALQKWLQAGQASSDESLPATTAELAIIIARLPPSKLRESLLALAGTCGDKIDDYKKAVEGWFNASMDRVTGWYKRFTQKWMILIGFLLAALFNVNTIRVVQELSNNPNLTKAIVTQAETYAKDKPSFSEEEKAAKLKAAKSRTTADESKTAANKNRAAADAKKTAANAKKTAAEGKNPDSDEKKEADKAEKEAAEAEKEATKAREEATKAQVDADQDATDAKRATEKGRAFQDSVTKLRETGIPIGWNVEQLKKVGLDQAHFTLGNFFRGVTSPKTNLRAFATWVSTYFVVLLSFVPGWALTALAASLGAPFWFDILGKFINVRNAGKAPGKKDPTKSSDEEEKAANMDRSP